MTKLTCCCRPRSYQYSRNSFMSDTMAQVGSTGSLPIMPRRAKAR